MSGGLANGVDYDGIVNNCSAGTRKVQDIVPAGLAGYNDATPFQATVPRRKASCPRRQRHHA